jgi:Tol biopolymer transport system component
MATEYNGVRDVFLHDADTQLTRRISNGYNGEADGMSVAPAVSGDGRHVAYASFATNLVTDDTNNVWDVFAHDRRAISRFS